MPIGTESQRLRNREAHAARQKRTILDVMSANVEDRPADEITGKDERRQFKGEARNASATFTHGAVGEVSPRA